MQYFSTSSVIYVKNQLMLKFASRNLSITKYEPLQRFHISVILALACKFDSTTSANNYRPRLDGADAKILESLYPNRSSVGIVDWFSHWLYDSESN